MSVLRQVLRSGNRDGPISVLHAALAENFTARNVHVLLDFGGWGFCSRPTAFSLLRESEATVVVFMVRCVF